MFDIVVLVFSSLKACIRSWAFGSVFVAVLKLWCENREVQNPFLTFGRP
ncbi:hypothetical protein V6Z12_A02G073600 [Gossypium hirsutum]